MFEKSSSYQLRAIDLRRRWRRYLLSFQIGMVLFFLDQIIKTACGRFLTRGEERPLFGLDFFTLTRVERIVPVTSEQMPLAILWILAVGFLIARVKRARGAEVVGYACMLSGVLSNAYSLWFSKSLIDTFGFRWAGHVSTFTLADGTIALGLFLLIAQGFRHLFQSPRDLIEA